MSKSGSNTKIAEEIAGSKTPIQESNNDHDLEVERMALDRPIKRRIPDDLESNVTTGSYQELPKRAKKWNASNFKLNKQQKVALDKNTEEGKYQRKLEETARQREKCTEICFKTFSDAEIFKENMKVKYFKFS